MSDIELFSSNKSARIVIVCNNTSEQAYLLDWCVVQGKVVADFMFENKTFPICYCPSGDIVGWLREMDRCIGYKQFSVFYEELMERVR